eukprot:2932167-Prymnesium_polylepis.1
MRGEDADGDASSDLSELTADGSGYGGGAASGGGSTGGGGYGGASAQLEPGRPHETPAAGRAGGRGAPQRGRPQPPYGMAARRPV